MLTRLRSVVPMLVVLLAVSSVTGVPARAHRPLDEAPDVARSVPNPNTVATSGALHGRVLDAQGAAVPGATVTIDCGRGPRPFTTDGQGRFFAPFLRPGPSQIDVALTGFSPIRTRATVVAGIDTQAPDLFLRVGGLEEVVEVIGAAPTVDTSSTTVGGVLSGRASRRESWRNPSARGSTAAFARIDESDFHRPLDAPHSTFSVDVDTASYAIVRRMLNDGQLPPPDAVRIEEMLNYFHYAYPRTDGNAPFSATTEVGPCPWSPGHRLALIGLLATPVDLRQTPRRNLVFLLDVSGSMASDDRLPRVKAAMGLLVEQLREQNSGEIGAGHSVTALYEIVPATTGEAKSAVPPSRYLDAPRLSPQGRSDELFSVALRYKTPQGDASRLIEQQVVDPGHSLETLPPNLGFAAAVVEAGLLLRHSKHRGDASYAQAAELARRFRGPDEEGYRAQFIRLV